MAVCSTDGIPQYVRHQCIGQPGPPTVGVTWLEGQQTLNLGDTDVCT